MQPILQVENLTKTYGGRGSTTTALKGISFTVEKGEFVGVMGASGSGKTTLLNCVSTIDVPTSGSITVGGQVLSGMKRGALAKFRRERLGFIFQDCNLLDTLTAFENIALALTISGTDSRIIRRKVEEMADLLEIRSQLDKYPYQMSGGQQQRTAAARALVTGPDLILADEPTGALDSKAARLLLERFRYLNESRDATLLMVTHDAFTASYCHRVIFLQDGEIYLELERGRLDRRSFFNAIIRVVSELGGEMDDVL